MEQYEINLLFVSEESGFREAEKRVLDLFREHQIEIYFEEDGGVRDLAYPIQKKSRGHYYHYQVKASSVEIKPLRKELNLVEQILRFLIIHLDKKAVKHFQKIQEKVVVESPEPVVESQPQSANESVVQPVEPVVKEETGGAVDSVSQENQKIEENNPT